MALPRRFLIASAASLTALVALAGPAFAHADASARAEQAGRTAITVSIEHGCNGNPVTGVRVALPSGATAVTGTNSGAWTSTVSATEIRLPTSTSVSCSPNGPVRPSRFPPSKPARTTPKSRGFKLTVARNQKRPSPRQRLWCPPTAPRRARQQLQSPPRVVRQPLQSLGWQQNQTRSPMREVRPTLRVATSSSVSVPSLRSARESCFSNIASIRQRASSLHDLCASSDSCCCDRVWGHVGKPNSSKFTFAFSHRLAIIDHLDCTVDRCRHRCGSQRW